VPILQIFQLPSSLQISQSTGIIIAIGLAVLIIIVAVALVIRARRRTASTREERISGIEKAPNTETYEEIAVSEGYRETTAIPLTEDSHQDLTYSQTSEVAHTAEEEPKDVVPPELPHDTTTIVKGNVYVGAVIASSSQAAEIRGELNALSYSEAITPIESVIDEQSLKTKIREVRDDLDSNETLSVILLKCIDIAKSLYRRADLKWIQRELFGTVEWNDAVYLDVSNEEVFPAYRLINGTMYVNYTRYGDSFPTVEEYDIPVFENRSVYALEKILEEANIHNQDYVVLNVPAPGQWPRTASLGELISLTVATKDYLDLLAAVRKQVYDFILSLDTSSS
jgi:hypothetical protein